MTNKYNSPGITNHKSDLSKTNFLCFNTKRNPVVAAIMTNRDKIEPTAETRVAIAKMKIELRPCKVDQFVALNMLIISWAGLIYKLEVVQCVSLNRTVKSMPKSIYFS